MQQPEIKRNWSTLLRLHRGFRPLPEIVPDQNEEVLNQRTLRQCCQQLRQITRIRAYELINQQEQKIAALEHQNKILQNQLNQESQYAKALEQKLIEAQSKMQDQNNKDQVLDDKFLRINTIKQMQDAYAQVLIGQLVNQQYLLPNFQDKRQSQDILLYSPRLSLQSPNHIPTYQQTPSTSDRQNLYKNIQNQQNYRKQRTKQFNNRKISDSQGQLSFHIQSEVQSYKSRKQAEIQKPHLYAYLQNLKYEIGQLKMNVQQIDINQIQKNQVYQEQLLSHKYLQQSKTKKLEVQDFFKVQIDSKLQSKQYQNAHLVRQNEQLRNIIEKYKILLRQLNDQIKSLRQTLQSAIQPCQFCSFKRALIEVLNE